MFPTMVYRCPGTHQCHGGTFETAGVKNQSQLDAFVKDGWFGTLPEAMVAKYGESAGTVVVTPPAPEAQVGELEVLGSNDEESDDEESDDEESDEIDPPTREELEKQAHELDIKFSKNISDEKLLERINEALEG